MVSKPMMHVWLAVLLAGWLGWQLPPGQSAEPDPFAALGLERFPVSVPLPEMSLPDLDGKSVELQSLKGQVVLMNFWTTW